MKQPPLEVLDALIPEDVYRVHLPRQIVYKVSDEVKLWVNYKENEFDVDVRKQGSFVTSFKTWDAKLLANLITNPAPLTS